MTEHHWRVDDHRIARAAAELQQLILAKYPSTTFDLTEGEDPEGIYLWATIDIDNTDDVSDVFLARLFELQVTEELPLYVLVERTLPHILGDLERMITESGASSRVKETA